MKAGHGLRARHALRAGIVDEDLVGEVELLGEPGAHEGKRFIAEDSRRDVLTAAIFAQTNGEYYMVNDCTIVGERNEVGEKIEDLVAQGKILKGDTVADLAAKMGCDPAVLEKTIADFNGVVANGNDPFGRKVFKNPIAKGPFYAVLRAPAVHHTMGGIKINEKAEAIGKDGKVIPGFYAAGEVTGGIHERAELIHPVELLRAELCDAAGSHGRLESADDFVDIADVRELQLAHYDASPRVDAQKALAFKAYEGVPERRHADSEFLAESLEVDVFPWPEEPLVELPF